MSLLMVVVQFNYLAYSEVAQLLLTLCDSMDCSPPGFSNPWNFLGKSTGVGCHFLLQGIFLTQGSNLGLCIVGRRFTVWATRESQKSESHSVVSDSLWPHGLYSPWNTPGQNTGVGSLSLLQGIFLTRGLNPRLLHCRRILYQVSYKGS